MAALIAAQYVRLASLPEDHPDLQARRKGEAKHVDNTVTKLILARHSTRSFRQTPVPNPVLEEILSLSQHAPSNSNVQPWRVHILTGEKLKRVSDGLKEKVMAGETPVTVPIPEQFRHYRSDMGHQLYGKEGYDIPREDKEAFRAAQMRNYSFFDAPCGAVFAMDSSLATIDALSVGMYLQTICLLLAERGLGTCVIASVVGYPDVLRKELGLEENMSVLTGLAIGYEDESHHVNSLKVKRDAWTDSVRFHHE